MLPEPNAGFIRPTATPATKALYFSALLTYDSEGTMKASGGSDALPELFRRSFRNSLYAKLSWSDNILTAWVEPE